MPLEVLQRLTWTTDPRHKVRAAATKAFGRLIPRLVWTGAVALAIAGAVVGIGVTVASNAPPEDVTVMALAYLVVIVPYVFIARAVDDLMR